MTSACRPRYPRSQLNVTYRLTSSRKLDALQYTMFRGARGTLFVSGGDRQTMVPSEVAVIQSSNEPRSVLSLDMPSLADSHLLGEAVYNPVRPVCCGAYLLSVENGRRQ